MRVLLYKPRKPKLLFMRKIFTLSIVLLLVFFAKAQLNYTVTYPTVTYAALTGAVTHPSLTIAYPSGQGVTNTDEGAANNVVLPFPLTYGCVTYNVCNISTNGFISFGAFIDTLDGYYANSLSFGPLDSNINSPLNHLRFSRPLIAPLWDDLDIQLSTNLTTQTSGTAPNRIFTVEWKSAKWNWLGTAGVISFQVKFYELDNSILFHYKTNGTGNTGSVNSGSASVGLADCSLGAGNFLSLNTLKNTANISSYTSTDTIKTKPATNFAIKFTPAQCNQVKTASLCHRYPVVTGEVFYDNNSNGVKDSTELNAANVKVKLYSGRYAFTDSKGYFAIYADSLGINNLTINSPNFYASSPQTISYTFNSFDTLVTSSFALQPTVLKDSMKLGITPINWRARPGFSYPYLISYKNIGTTTISPLLNFNFDDTKLIYDSSNNLNVINSTNDLALNISNIVPGQTGSFIAYFRVKPTVVIGDSVVVNATLTNAVNTKVVSIVGGSFDPNDKEATQVLTPTQVTLGKEIIYTIRFQNTGNDTAFNVTISDSLSSDLQANTLELVESSHNCKTTVNGNVVLFELFNIRLPDSNVNEIGSHGFVRFRVKPKATLINGDNVSNTAFIYFDYNVPVVTNTAITQINTTGIITPVKLMNYNLQWKNNKKQILNSWATATEVNTSYFNIQRSLNGKEFTSIGTVAAKGFGNYEFADNQLPVTRNQVMLYYRLEVVDKDGSKTYSDVREFAINNLPLTINIYPNPAKEFVTIECEDGIKEVKIIDYLGREISHFVRNDGNIHHLSLNIHHYPKGLYIVKIITSKGELKTEKLLVE